MDLSIIIITRNTCDAVCAAIRSVRDSGDGVAKEILVVDNGSTDGTENAIQQQFPGVRLLRREENLGFARAANLAVREAQGELLLLLNSDAILEAGALRVAVDAMRKHSRCGIAGGQLLNPDGTRQNSIANFPTLATELLNKSLLRLVFPERFPGKEHHYTEPVKVESVVGAFFLTRRTVWDKLGGLDERFFFFFEETDFCLRAHQQGWEVLHLPFVQVRHEQGKSARQWSAGARIEYWRSRYTYFAKNHSTKTLLLLKLGLRARLLVNLAGAVLMALITVGSSARHREKLRMRWAIAQWHGRGCPSDGGLPR